MTREEIIEAISDDKMMSYIEPYQLSEIVNFVIKNYKPSLPSNLDEAQKKDWLDKYNEDVDAVLGSSIYSEKGLDEAAEKEIERFCSDIVNIDSVWANMPLTKRFGLQMAKFGVEWIAGQGWHEEAVIKGSYDVVWLNYNVELPIDLAKYFKPGDNVIVQIRKK